MGARRTELHRLQERVRLHRQGTSAREAARSLGMSRNPVSGCLTALRSVGPFPRGGRPPCAADICGGTGRGRCGGNLGFPCPMKKIAGQGGARPGLRLGR